MTTKLINAQPYRQAICQLKSSGITYTQLARITGVHPNTIRLVGRRPRHSVQAGTAALLSVLVDMAAAPQQAQVSA